LLNLDVLIVRDRFLADWGDEGAERRWSGP
jgi:hypothetical protein